ncbi:MAG TPA: class I SAM-dependent methyltransferase [Thermoanaerobaculia bacterium]
MRLLTRFRARPDRLAPAAIARRKAELEQVHGPWTAHNCRLAEGVWTVRDGAVNFDEKVRRALQIAHDFFGPTLSGLAVLDLGAGEGGLSLELAAHGARVVCVEGREASLAKARFAAEALGLRGIDFVREDVRAFDAGPASFDLVICYGLLYHLDAEGAFAVVAKMARLARRLLILDTHFSLAGPEAAGLGGEEYRGRSFREHPEGATPEQKAAQVWGSLDNETSFWLTKPSLLNLLNRAGFGTVYEVASPLVYDYWDRATGELYRYRDRATLVAVKASRAKVLTSPRVSEVSPRPVPETLSELMIASPIDREHGG